jgi:23S rRNA (guanine745-N1)-methyltransferase
MLLEGHTLRCANHHSYDIARQGYVTLAGTIRHRGDTAAMLDARGEFLAGGHFDPIADAVTAAAAGAPPGPVLDVGAGTGFYQARVLDALADRVGYAIDASSAAARRAARSHPRAWALVCDVWEALPFRTGAAALVLNVFAPRNPAEMRRVLADDGRLVVVHPTPHHLHDASEALGLLGIEPDRERVVHDRLAPLFERVEARRVEYTTRLDAEAAGRLARMGPSAWHDREALPEAMEATVSVDVEVYRPRASSSG